MIELSHVSKTYGDHPALSDITLTVNPGELCVLIGPSGCGKSTLLKLVNRLEEATAGVVRLNGVPVTDLEPTALRRGIGYVIQSVGLFPHWTVAENIALVPGLLHWPRERVVKRVQELMELMGLQSRHLNRYPIELSGGEAQRVGVARALAADPPVLLMDEPFGALDPLLRERLQKEFLSIQKHLRKTVVFVTHDVDEAIRLSDRLVVMQEGRLVAAADPRSYIRTEIPPFAAAFLGSEYGLRLLARYHVGQILRSPAEAPGSVRPVPPDMTLKEALSRMLAENTQSLPVGDPGAPTGSVHLKDILNLYREWRYAETL